MYQNSYQPYQNQNCYYNVNGYEGAKNFQLAPNQSVLLIDTMQPYLYYKSTNQMGQITIKTYKLEELADNPEKLAQNELLGAFDARLKTIEEKLNAKSIVKCNVNQLELQNAVANVVRYPTSSTYTSGNNPFCGCGCGQAI